MPAVVQHLAGPSTGSTSRRPARWRRPGHRDAAGAVSFAGPGKTERRAAPGGRCRRARRARVRGRGPAGRRGRRGPRGPAAGRGPGEPRLRGQGLGDADGRRPAAVRRRRRAGAGAARAGGRPRPGPRGFHVFAGSQNLHAEILAEAQRETVELVLALADKCPEPLTLPQPRRRVRHPVLREGPAARPRPGRRQPADAGRRRDPPGAATARVVVELGRYLVGEAGVYVTRVVDRKVSRGTDLPGRRRRHAPPARRVGQLRSGDPAQLPDRGRQPRRRAPPTDR